MTQAEEAEAVRRQQFVLKQLIFFWPIVTNDDDVDRVELFNYQLCSLYAGWSLFSGLLALFLFREAPIAPIPIFLVLAPPLFYFLGANASRQDSVPAAWAMAAYTSLPAVSDCFGHKFRLDRCLFFLGSLVVLRGTFLTARWRRTRDVRLDTLRLGVVLAQASPFRQAGVLPPVVKTTSWFRLTHDTWPPILWRRLQWLFWLVATLLSAEYFFFAYLILRDGPR